MEGLLKYYMYSGFLQRVSGNTKHLKTRMNKRTKNQNS